MAVDLRAPSLGDVEQVRKWREHILPALRTPFPLTREQQEDFYHDVVCDRQATSRWWSVYRDGRLIGLVGLVGIQWENGLAEVSLTLAPTAWCYGGDVVEALLEEGLGNLGLETIWGECYLCAPTLGFWERMVDRFGGYKTMLPRRKRWQGQLHDSMWFGFWRD